MSEFLEVARQYRWMCEFYSSGRYKCCETDDGEECPLYHGRPTGACLRDFRYSPERMEAAVMKWAAEHPEPVYPMWQDVLIGMGLLKLEESRDGSSMETRPDWDAIMKRIDAKTAQALGIEPVNAKGNDA